MSGQGGKGGGAVQAPNLTDRGTFFNDQGVEMMPMRGPGGAAPIPLSEYNEKYGAPSPFVPKRGDGGNMAAQPTSAGFNVNDAAASGLQNAMSATTNAMYGPLNVGAFNNPYQQQVVDNVQQDIERQRQMAMNTLGAQAQGAGAYGGSRQGVAEGVTNAEYGRMAANQLGNLRMQGYNTAMANAMADRTSRLGAASQLGSMTNQAFNTGRTINQDLVNQGLLQQSLQQALIDAAKGDFANYANAPMNSLTTPLAALGASPKPYQQTTSQNPGLLGTLGAIKYFLGPQAAVIPG